MNSARLRTFFVRAALFVEIFLRKLIILHVRPLTRRGNFVTLALSSKNLRNFCEELKVREYMSKILIFFLIGLNFLFVYLLMMSRFYPLESVFLRIAIYKNETASRAIVEFQDHPPWCHSRFFNADYDYDHKTIILNEYYMPFHFLSKPMNQHCELVLNPCTDGKYQVYSAKLYVGDIIFSNGTVTWNPAESEGK